MRLIDADALLYEIVKRYCDNCDRRMGIKNGKRKVIYEIGDVPCRVCRIDDAVTEIDNAPTIEPTRMMCNGEHIKCPAHNDYERGYKDREAEVLAVIENLRDKCGNEEMAFALNWAKRLISEKQKMDEVEE